MEKANYPTSKYTVACDHFDSFATAEIHQTDDGLKLKLTIESESKDSELSISLFEEDVRMLISFLRAANQNIRGRLENW